MDQEDAVLYHEPSILTILVLSSFLLALVVVDFVLDAAVYCGLIGQIFIGLAYGTPGGNILGDGFQQSITDLGYLGLILLVYEGGLSTDIKALQSNAILSVLVAFTGISLPVGTSFVLVSLCGASLLQAFAAGCALSSTSLGTTFTILKSSGLDKTRLGVVLTSAAMLDDVIGLVLVQVISNLGSSGRGFTAAVVVKPIMVSLGYALVVPIILFIYQKLANSMFLTNFLDKFAALRSTRGQLSVQTLVLVTAVASAAYAGTSTLLAAYLAGLLITSCEAIMVATKNNQKSQQPKIESSKTDRASAPVQQEPLDGHEAWEMVTASDPDSIVPHTPKRTEAEASAENTIGCTARKNESAMLDTDAPEDEKPYLQQSPSTNASGIFDKYYSQPLNRVLKPFFFASIGLSIPIKRLFSGPALWRGIVYAILMTFGKTCCSLWLMRFSSSHSSSRNVQPGTNTFRTTLLHLASYRPLSLYPAFMLGCAMVARGEIGFLISAIAQSNGIFDQGDSGSDIYLIVTWAILLCTIIGPLTVGLLARRVKTLERKSHNTEGSRTEHPLGIWKDL